MMHTLVCRLDNNWSVHIREHETVPWSMAYKGRDLRATVEASFDIDPLSHPWTFSERQSTDVMANLAEEPEQIGSLDRGLDVTILAPEGRFEGAADDRWATMRYSPGGGPLWSAGLSDLFRPKALRAQIVEMFPWLRSRRAAFEELRDRQARDRQAKPSA